MKTASILLVNLLGLCSLTLASGAAQAGPLQDWGKKASDGFKGATRGGGLDYKADMRNEFNEIIDHAIGTAAPAAVDVVHKSSDYVFDQKINPLLDHANLIAGGLINQVGNTVDGVITTAGAEAQKRADAVIDHAMQEVVASLDPWVKQAVSEVDKFTPAELEKHLINASFDRLDSLEKDLFRQTDNLITKVDMMIDNKIQRVDCAVDGTLSRILAETKEAYLKNLLPNPFDHCRTDFGLGDRVGTDLTYGDFYNLDRCHMLDDIKPDSPVRLVITRYSDLANLASRYRCMESAGDVAMTGEISLYSKDWYYAEMQLKVWQKLGGSN